MLKTDFDYALSEFLSITSRAIPISQRDAWWRKLENRDGAQFIRACKALAITEERIPPLAKILDQMGQYDPSARVDCPRCIGTGFIPFFQVKTITSGDKKYQSGSFATGRCSCPAGDRMWDGIAAFDSIPEFRGEPEMTHLEYSLTALQSEERWLRTVHWPRLYSTLQKGRQKTLVGRAISATPKTENIPF